MSAFKLKGQLMILEISDVKPHSVALQGLKIWRLENRNLMVGGKYKYIKTYDDFVCKKLIDQEFYV